MNRQTTASVLITKTKKVDKYSEITALITGLAMPKTAGTRSAVLDMYSQQKRVLAFELPKCDTPARCAPNKKRGNFGGNYFFKVKLYYI